MVRYIVLLATLVVLLIAGAGGGRPLATSAATAGLPTATTAATLPTVTTPFTALAAPSPPVKPFMGALRNDLNGLVGAWAGSNAVSVTDLQTGQTVSVNGSRPLPAACTIKIFIMFAVAQDIEAGRYRAADVADLVQGAMGPSATWPARELLRIVGGNDVGTGVRRVNQIMWDLGAQDSILTHPPDYPEEEYGYKASRGITENLLVADELNMMLGKLYRGEALSPWATDYVLWSMTLAIPGQQQSLGGPLPASAMLYHKIGLIYEPQNTWNDAGIVTFEAGGKTYAYAISYLGSYGTSWLDAYEHGASVSAAAWRAFSSFYAPAAGNGQCFDATGKCVRGPFYQYWQDNGGLAQQGYPLTDEFVEVNPATAQVYTVQYFERARFEYHPENAPPYDVLLGQVGREQYAAKPRSAPTPAAPAPGDVCFAETKQCVRDTFYAYWQRNGGLAQQGYPISSEFDEVSPTDGKTYRVQYFERARFEYHPEYAGTAYEVLLGQLGRDQFVLRYPGGEPSATLAAATLPGSPAELRQVLLRQLADFDLFWRATPHGSASDAYQGWAGYHEALERFLMTRPQLRGYLLWYYRASEYGPDQGLIYHPSGTTLRDPRYLERYLALLSR